MTCLALFSDNLHNMTNVFSSVLIYRLFKLIVSFFFFAGKNLYNNEHVAVKCVSIELCEL